jgi:hypothetical protein
MNEVATQACDRVSTTSSRRRQRAVQGLEQRGALAAGRKGGQFGAQRLGRFRRQGQGLQIGIQRLLRPPVDTNRLVHEIVGNVKLY